MQDNYINFINKYFFSLSIKKLLYNEKIKLLKKEDCSLNIIEILLNDNDDNIRYLAAKHYNIPLEKLRKLVLSKSNAIKQGTAENINSNEDILDILLKDKNGYIRYKAAKNFNLSKEKLKKLVLSSDYSKDSYIKEGVGLNPNSNEEILDILLKDKDNNIRYYTSMYSDISLKKLKELVLSEDLWIKIGISKRMNLDEDILDLLSKDVIRDIRLEVLFNKTTSSKILNNLYKEFPEEVLRHPNCPNYIKVILR